MKIIILILLLFPSVGYCQYCLKIDSLIVYEMIESLEKDIIEEGFGEGPIVHGYFTLCNYSNNTLVIPESYITLVYCYEYKGKQCSSQYTYCDANQDSLTVLPMDSISIDGGAYLMIDMCSHKSKRQYIHSMNIIDHSEVFKQILPFLYVQIVDFEIEIIRSPTYNTWSFIDNNNKTIFYPVKIQEKNEKVVNVPSE